MIPRQLAAWLPILLLACKANTASLPRVEGSPPPTVGGSAASSLPKSDTPAALSSKADHPGATGGTTPAASRSEAGNAEAERHAAIPGEQVFAAHLYAQLPRGGNLVFSPMSARVALAMAYEGARGDTAMQMQNALVLGSPDKTRPGLIAEIRALKAGDPAAGEKLYATNRLWAQLQHPFRPEFLQLLEKDYGAPLAQIDFVGDPNGGRAQINAFVEKATDRMIKDLLPAGAIDRDTRFVITNAVYFKALWKQPFSKTSEQAEFAVSSAKSVHLPLMRVESEFRYAKVDGYQLVELPYQSGRAAMIVVVPDAKFGVGGDDEKPLRDATLESWVDALRPEAKVRLDLPPFRKGTAFSLKAALGALGMSRAFARDADFSGMDGQHDLHISEVVQQARVDVDEKGTEAAAATAVIGMRPLIARRPQEPIIVRADHPFLFIIRDTATGSILFMGRITDPT